MKYYDKNGNTHDNLVSAVVKDINIKGNEIKNSLLGNNKDIQISDLTIKLNDGREISYEYHGDDINGAVIIKDTWSSISFSGDTLDRGLLSEINAIILPLYEDIVKHKKKKEHYTTE